MTATCFIGNRLRINIPVVKKNDKTVWVQIYRKDDWGKPVKTYVKRHITKHNVTLN